MSTDTGSVPIPVIGDIDTRDGTLNYDSLHVNALVDKDSGGNTIIRKRPGFTATSRTPSGYGGGVYVDNNTDDLFEIRGTGFYHNGTHIANVTAVTNYTFTGSGNLTPSPFITFHGLDKKVYMWSYGAPSGILSTSIPTTAPGLALGYAQLDGSFYVMDTEGAIWGSDILNPLVFDPLNKIVMPLEEGSAEGIFRHYDHIIVFGSMTMAVYVDIGNAVGSPLQQATNYFRRIGTYDGATITSVNDELTWISQSATGYLKVSRMEGLQSVDISTPAVEKIMNNPDYTVGTSAYCVNLKDRYLYVISILDETGNFNLAFDSRYKVWYNWQMSNTQDGLGQRIPDAVFTRDMYDTCTYTTLFTNVLDPWVYSYISYQIGDAAPEFIPISSLSNGKISIRLPFSSLGSSFVADVQVYSTLSSINVSAWNRNIIQTVSGALLTVNSSHVDLVVDGVDTIRNPILFRSRSGEIDLNSLDLKSIVNMDFLADMSDGVLYFRITLDDYQSYQAWRSGNLQTRLRFTDLGSFERMAIDIVTLDELPFRLRRIDLRIAKNG